MQLELRNELAKTHDVIRDNKPECALDASEFKALFILVNVLTVWIAILPEMPTGSCFDEENGVINRFCQKPLMVHQWSGGALVELFSSSSYPHTISGEPLPCFKWNFNHIWKSMEEAAEAFSPIVICNFKSQARFSFREYSVLMYGSDCSGKRVTVVFLIQLIQAQWPAERWTDHTGSLTLVWH